MAYISLVVHRKRIVKEENLDRVEKLAKYYEHFNVGERYGISFIDFERRVNEGTWVPYLVDDRQVMAID